MAHSDVESLNLLNCRILNHVPIGIFVADEQHRIVHWNRWLEQKTGFTQQQVLGKTLDQLYPGYHKPRLNWALQQVIRHRFSQILSQALNRFVIPIAIPHTGRHGIAMMQQHCHISPLVSEQGQCLAVVSVIDVTDEVVRSSRLTELAQKLENDSNRDPLTGLFNRRFMWEWLVQQLRQCARFSYPMTCLMLDLDHFKRINDTHGHVIGDQVLKKFASMATELLRDSDILVRYGGEEFVALLPHCAEDKAMLTAERILNRLRATALPPLEIGEVTCSAGFAVYTPQDPLTGEQLLKRADRYLYEAKNSGRDRVVGAKPSDLTSQPTSGKSL
jgi:diguanylate cyclase (GGDEF)-like protein/PAS domain S-box-containing protein